MIASCDRRSWCIISFSETVAFKSKSDTLASLVARVGAEHLVRRDTGVLSSLIEGESSLSSRGGSELSNGGAEACGNESQSVYRERLIDVHILRG